MVLAAALFSQRNEQTSRGQNRLTMTVLSLKHDERNYFAQVQLQQPMTLLGFNTGIWMRGFFLEYE